MRRPKHQREELSARKKAVKKSLRNPNRNYIGESGYGEWEEIDYHDIREMIKKRKG